MAPGGLPLPLLPLVRLLGATQAGHANDGGGARQLREQEARRIEVKERSAHMAGRVLGHPHKLQGGPVPAVRPWMGQQRAHRLKGDAAVANHR